MLTEYVRYHHEDRTHLGIAKQTSASRIPSVVSGRIVSQTRLGGLHHRYDRLPDPDFVLQNAGWLIPILNIDVKG